MMMMMLLLMLLMLGFWAACWLHLMGGAGQHRFL
jgi:hypothetical protein